MAILSGWGLILSHRIAGPIYALSRRMNDIVGYCDLSSPLKLREKDALQEVKDELNLTIDSLREKIKSEADRCGNLLEKMASMENTYENLSSRFKAIRRQLEILKKEKEQWLRNSHSL